MKTLQTESELDEIVRLVGMDSLSPPDRLTMETARMIREDFLQQDAFGDVDSYSHPDRQIGLLRLAFDFDTLAREVQKQGVPLQKLFSLPVLERIGRAKNVPSEQYKSAYQEITEALKSELSSLTEEEASAP